MSGLRDRLTGQLIREAKMNQSVPIEEIMKRVVHPCDSWARGAQQESWREALLAMNGGKVLCGPAPSMGSMGKSTLGLTMFFEQVKAEGLHAYPTESGQVVLGLKENFPAEMLARQEREEAKVASRLNLLPPSSSEASCGAAGRS